MPQNIYDNPNFFQRYSQLARSTQGLLGAPEWPTLRSFLPDLTNMRVLDLGCGFGWFSRWAIAAGARSVLGIDLSENMLAKAQAATTEANIEYLRCDLEDIELPESQFDFAFSSLTLHYLVDLHSVIAKTYAALRPGARLVFSVEHPIFLAPNSPTWQGSGPNSEPIWPLNRYLDEGPRTVEWLGNKVIKQHRTVASYLRLLLQLGFTLRAIDEWSPTIEQSREHPEWRIERHRPYFLLISAQRK